MSNLPAHVATDLVNLAQMSPEREICGLILREWEVYPMANVATDGSRRFTMDEGALLRVYQERYDDIIGMYHSHPGGRTEPSDIDRHNRPPNSWRYWIIARDRVHEWILVS